MRWRRRVRRGLSTLRHTVVRARPVQDAAPEVPAPRTTSRTPSGGRTKGQPRAGRDGRLRNLTALTGRPGGRRVVLLTHPERGASTERMLRQLRDDVVTVMYLTVDPALEPEQVAGPDAGPGSARARETRVVWAPSVKAVMGDVQAHGSLDLVVVSLPARLLPSSCPTHYELFLQLFPYLRRGGAFLLDRATEDRTVGALWPPEWQKLLELVNDGPGATEAVGRRERGVAESVGSVVLSRRYLLATTKRRHLLKLDERQVEALLPTREPRLRMSVVERRPAGSLVPLLEEHSYGPAVGAPWPQRIDHPEMTVRHYEGAVSSGGGMLLYGRDTILPDSFRWPFAAHIGNKRLESVQEVAWIRNRFWPQRKLPGDYYFLDCAYSGHFGHLMTEVVSRLWGWDQAKRELPDLKAFFHVRPHRHGGGRLERALFTAYGIAEEDLVSVAEPVKLRSVVSATPLWHNHVPHYVHPDIRETWSKLTSGFLNGEPAGPHERLFVSRGGTLSSRRGCRNQRDVESFFAARGFHVLYPEEHSFAEQVAFFAGARVVAGFGGSAMFNVMHTQRLEATIVLSSNAYTARNEHLFASVLGGELHYFWSPADVPLSPQGRTKESHRSSWAFDFAAWGPELERVVASL